MSEEFDPFALGSGLPLADQNVTVIAAVFKFDLEYSADACVIGLTFQPDEEGMEEQEQLYSCGKNMEPLDQGSAMGHTSGKQVKVNEQTNYGRFMKHAFACEGFLDMARESGNTPFDAALWEGSQWHLTTVEYETRNPSKPMEPAKVRTAVVPDEFLGYGDDEEEEAPPAKKSVAKKLPAKKGVAAKKAAPAKIPGAQTKTLNELAEEEGGEELIEALRELAAECEDHDTFMEQAMEVEGVTGNRLAEKAVMSDKAGSIWADAQE